MTVIPAVTAKYSLGPVKSWVENAAYSIGPQFGIKTIYGWRKSDPFPDHPGGLALDFMIPSKTVGKALADFVVANYISLGVRYVIWDHRVWNPKDGWHPYTSTSNPHTDHVHVTFNSTPGTGTAITPAGYDTASNTKIEYNAQTCAWSVSFPVAGNSCLLSKATVRSLLGGTLILTGIGIGLVGTILLVVYGLGKSGAASYIPGPLGKAAKLI